MARRAVLQRLGRVDYQDGWCLQRDLLRARCEGRSLDTILLVEHAPVFTIGRTGVASHWGGDIGRLVDAGTPVYHVERGGSITFHGPGQLVGYPILRLSDFCTGPKAYMRLLEEVLIRTVREWGIDATRREKLTGVWIERPEPAKIAAMGVKIERGVTMHGFALNVAMDLSPFRRIVPCGIADCRVTSMAEILGEAPLFDAVCDRVAAIFAEVFNLEWVPGGSDGFEGERMADPGGRCA